MFEQTSVAGFGTRRTTDTRHLLPPPQYSQLHEELGARLARVAAVNEALIAAQAELAGAIARSDEAATMWKRIQGDPDGDRLRSGLQRERGHAIAQASMMRLHVRRLEAELQDAMRRVAELSDVEARIASTIAT